MPANNPITLPAGYASAFAIGFSDESGELALVNLAKPLPVQTVTDVQTAAPTPLTGAASIDMLAGPYARR